MSPSTVINLSVSDASAQALCAASNPYTPWTLFAQGTFFLRFAKFFSPFGSSKLKNMKKDDLMAAYDKIMSSYHEEEDDLEIPAFLRRQKN